MNNEFERYLAILEGKQEKLELLKLPYSRDALSPVISKETINYHYANLAQAYVDRFNKGEGDDKFNKAGAFLHNLYFPGLKEPSSKNQPTGKSAEIINKKYKSFDAFKEAVLKQAIELAFKNLDIVRIFARPYGSNKASQRVIEKLGFTKEAHIKQNLYKWGEWEDELIYGLRKGT